MTEFLRVRAISQRTIEREVKEQFSNFMTDAVAEIIVQRGLLDKDQIDLLGFVHEDPDEEFVAAVRDAVQVNFVYEAAREHHRMEAGCYDRAVKNAGQKDEVQGFVKKLATSHPALVGPSTLHAVDEMIAELHASAPWMADVSTWIYKTLRARYNTGQTWFALPPVILVGPPGCGKSTYARKLATLSGAPDRTLDAGASNASFTVAGSDPTWSKAQAGIPLQEIAKSGTANPVMIVDEIEKAGTMTSKGGSSIQFRHQLVVPFIPRSSFQFSALTNCFS
ncbi:MAG: AAA family ATPase [Paracoccaceae bacterium]